MSAEFRWVCLLPDPVTGLDQPMKAVDGTDMVWHAPNREIAIRRVKASLLPNSFRLASVVSWVDWQSRLPIKQRAKFTSAVEQFGGINPRQRCFRCGGITPTRHCRYCNNCRRRGGRQPGQRLDHNGKVQKNGTDPINPLDPTPRPAA